MDDESDMLRRSLGSSSHNSMAPQYRNFGDDDIAFKTKFFVHRARRLVTVSERC